MSRNLHLLMVDLTLQQKRLKGRGKLYGEDDLLHQRPSISAIAPVCGALAKTSRDAESSYTANFPPTVEEPNESRPQREEPSSRPDAAMPEDLEEASANEDDDEFEWEQGEETFAGTSDDKGSTKEQVWNGDITIQVETKAQKRAAQRKPPARRANARDKVTKHNTILPSLTCCSLHSIWLRICCSQERALMHVDQNRSGLQDYRNFSRFNCRSQCNHLFCHA